jgi:hypothetical protein
MTLMIIESTCTKSWLRSVFLALVLAPASWAQFGYGVNGTGGLFRFDLASPNNAVSSIGNLGFVPEGIDFRPGTGTLYAIDIGAVNSQLYTVNTSSGMATPIGAGFPSTGSVGGTAYDLTTSQTFGFDFNPRTLQADGSIRIRLVGNAGANLRLHSDTGQIAAVDGSLSYAAGDANSGTASSVDAVAYINSNASTIGGATTLYDLDYGTDDLSIQNPPNNGVLNTVGSLGVTVNALANAHFDILTQSADADATIVGDTGYATLLRPDAPVGDPGKWLVYQVDLASGQIGNGALVGIAGGNPAADFTGGFAALIPEPCSIQLLTLGSLGCLLAIRGRYRI